MPGYCFGRIGGQPPKSAKMVGKIFDPETRSRRGFFRQKAGFGRIVLSNQSNITAAAPGYGGAAAVCNGSNRMSRTIP
jgi:hypothetical protein